MVQLENDQVTRYNDTLSRETIKLARYELHKRRPSIRVLAFPLGKMLIGSASM